MIRRLFRAAPLALICAAAGCSYTLDATRLGVPTTLAESATAPPAGTPFKVDRLQLYLFWGAIVGNNPNLEDVLAGQVGTGASLANVRVRVRSTLTDVLITGLTLGVIVPRTMTVEGVIVSR